MDSPLPSPRLARKASSLPPALTPMLKTLGLEEDDPEDVFEIHSKEGAGAFGRVFRASYRSDPNRLAALKVIPVALEAGQRGEDIENVRREIQFLRECDHPNVVAFYGAYYKDHALWLAMEYCGGGSVGDVSRRRNLLEDEIAIITRGALHGLAYLHARKKIHRDIKGGNILLSSTGEVKIADFGVSAQLKDTMSRRGTFVGTPYWMSPEMIQDSDYDYKSDIWSLGITLIELADQKPPLFDEHPMRVLIQIPRNPPPSVKQPTAWSPLLSVFLQFCLRKDPKERPSAVDCLGHAFIQRVEAMPYVFAEGMEARRLAEAEAPAEADAAEAKADQAAAAEGNEKTAKSLQANSTSGRTMGSLTSTSARDSEVMADDVTLRARPSKLMIEQPPPAQTEEDVEAKADESIELERQILSHPTTEDNEAGVTTPRDRESVVDEVLKLSPTSARSMSPNSSCSEVDDDGESNDATAEGFAFRHDPPATVAKKPPVEMVSGDELLQLSVDDSFEMPAMTLISKIQAAASTLAGQSTRPRVAALPIPTPPPLPLPLPSAPSPILKASRKGSVLDESRLPSPSSSSSDPPPPRPAAVIRRDLYSFSRTDSISRAVPPSGEENTSSRSGGWTNPLAQLTMPSHDRVNSLLSSLSASTSRLLLPPPQPLDVSAEFDGRASLRSISRPSPPPPLSSSIQMTNSISSSSHNPFIGSPFRVSHPLNVTYNTIDAKFEGVPTNPEWMAVHQQFGLPLAHLKCRSNSTTPHVPALVQMLRRELFRRDGLHCKYIYRVSPEQSELQHAKQMIQRGAFDPTSVSDPHVFASLLKIWLRDLPVPLLGALRQSDLAAVVERLVSPDDHDAGSGGNDATREIVFAVAFPDVHAVVTTAVLAPLPTGERAVLLWLVDHMLEVISQSALNAMTAQSLTVVIAPNVFRWAATTPAEASAISKQVATLLRVLLAWRQRCRGGGGGGGGERDGGSSGEREACSLSVRSRTGKTEGTATVHNSGASVSIRDSLNGLRLSLHGIPNSSVSRDSTVSSILRRSNLPVAASNHFVSASYSEDHCISAESSSEPSVQRVVSLEMMLRDCVDELWNELPLSIMLDDPPPIVRSLHAKFQRNMLSLIVKHARRPQERRWATERLASLEDKPKARLMEQETTLNLPLSLRVYTRWLHAVLEFKAFTALLQQERLVRDRLEKRWPTHSSTADSTSGSTVENAFAMSQLLVLAATDQHYNSSVQKTDETEQAMLDGAATYLRVLHQSLTSYGKETSTVMPLAEELVANGKQEPALGNLLVAMSRSYMSRYHLETYYQDIVAMVERSLQTA